MEEKEDQTGFPSHLATSQIEHQRDQSKVFGKVQGYLLPVLEYAKDQGEAYLA
jgi:hypothetical protein